MYLSELIVDFIEHVEVERGRSQRTAENYHLYLMRLVEFVGDVEIEKINEETIRKYRLWLNRYQNDNGDGLSTLTQSYHLIALRSFLTYVSKRGFDSMAADKIDLPKVKRKQVTFLNEEEVGLLFAAVDASNEQGKRDKAIIELLFTSGLRVSELVKLNRDHVNTARREFTVRGKGQKDRLVIISEAAATAVENYLSIRRDSLAPLFISYGGRATVDTSGDYRRLTARSVQRLVSHYAKLAGITKHVSPHTMRHSFATDLLMNGADIRSVQSLLGHANIATTQVYTHVTDQHLKEVHERFQTKR